MKKIIWAFVALFSLMLSPANGQVGLGIQGGVNIATASFDKEILDADNVTGFQIGPVLEVMFPFTGGGFDLALLYSQKGFEHRDEGIVNDFLEVPFNLKWKLDLPVVKPYLAAGPYVSFRIGGDQDWEVTYGGITDQIRSKNFAAGVNVGGGVELLNHLRVGLTHSWGLTDNYSVSKGNLGDVLNGKGKSRTWSITAAILF